MKRPKMERPQTRLLLLFTLMLALFALLIVIYLQRQQDAGSNLPVRPATQLKKPAKEPEITTTEVLAGLSRPWDAAFLPDGTLLFNERRGTVSKLVDGQRVQIARIADVYAVGEGGLTGLALDTNFAENRYLYTCFNARTSSGLDVRVARWRLSDDASQLTDRRDVVTGIPAGANGRHSGCRVKSDTKGNLWIGTGDAAMGGTSQSPTGLGGKILHVTRDGMPAGGNLPDPFDPRIFSYGHRNVQGIVLFDEPQGGIYGYSIEHGSDRDDEINLLKNGNFGWAPRVTYVESGIPMTDLGRFPDAVQAIWSSGSPTIAPSGATLLKGEEWGTWEGAIAMAVLKGQHLRIMRFDESRQLVEEKEIVTDVGRIRSATLGPGGELYVTTDNGVNDKIIKIAPRQN